MVQRKVLRVGANYRAVLRLYGINLPLSEPRTSNLVCPLVFSHTSAVVGNMRMPSQADNSFELSDKEICTVDHLKKLSFVQFGLKLVKLWFQMDIR